MAFTNRQDPPLKEQQLLEHARLSDQTLQALREVFHPELLNRVDDIVIFHALEPEQLCNIIDLFLEQTRQRLALQRIDLRVTDSARALLLKQGYEKEYGARPLRHIIQHLLEDRIAEAMLKGRKINSLLEELAHIENLEKRFQSQEIQSRIKAILFG